MYFKFEFPNTDIGKQILMWILEKDIEKQIKNTWVQKCSNKHCTLLSNVDILLEKVTLQNMYNVYI